MDFVDALRVLGRRWLVVLLGVLVTGGAGFYAITVVPTEYQARAQYVLLLPSGATGVNNPTNPYINLNSGLIFVTALIASDLGTKDVARSLVKGGFESDYSVAQSTSGGPSLDVVVNGTDPDDVLATRNELLGRFDEELDSLQDVVGIPDRQLIFSRTNAVDPVAEVVPGAKKKALVLIAAVGMIVTLIMAFSMDGLLRRRRARKLALKETAAGEPEPPEDGPTKTESTRSEPARAERAGTETDVITNQAAKPEPGRNGAVKSETLSARKLRRSKSVSRTS